MKKKVLTYDLRDYIIGLVMFILSENKKTVLIATASSKNKKTGSGIQIWILDATMHPIDSRRTGHDAVNQCKGCSFASGNGCYVTPLPISAIWRAWKAGVYSKLIYGTKDWNEFFDGAEFVRLGAYGNPSLIPLRMVKDIGKRAKNITGYFHDWHIMPPSKAKAYGEYLMASCEKDNWEKAQAIGLRTFTVCEKPEDSKVFGIECIADVTNKRIQCKDCGLCDGNRRKDKIRPSIWIKAHGYQSKKALAAVK